MSDDDLYCSQCDREVDPEEATRRTTYGDLDEDRWQTLCCPECGPRLKTVFVGTDE
jgi:hypothetical protein